VLWSGLAANGCHLNSNKSRTLPFENRKNILSIALSPDGNVLMSIDEGQQLNVRTKLEQVSLKLGERFI
jgi:hypothetical protein